MGLKPNYKLVCTKKKAYLVVGRRLMNSTISYTNLQHNILLANKLSGKLKLKAKLPVDFNNN